MNAEEVTAAGREAVQFPCRAGVCPRLTHSCRFFDLCQCAALRALTRPTIVRSTEEIQRGLLRSNTCFARARGGPQDRIDGGSNAWRAVERHLHWLRQDCSAVPAGASGARYSFTRLVVNVATPVPKKSASAATRGSSASQRTPAPASLRGRVHQCAPGPAAPAADIARHRWGAPQFRAHRAAIATAPFTPRFSSKAGKCSRASA